MNRQRNLTWIEKKQIEKIAFDHPFFDTHGTVLSKKEAKAIIHSAEMRKSGTEIVTEACDRAGVPRPDFVDNHYTVFENLKEVIAIPAIRRIGIIAIALILLIVFFTATPTGRAIAESVIHYIATLFDDGSLAVSQSDNKTILFNLDHYGDNDIEFQEDQTEFVYLDSFDDFIRATGKTPFVLPLSFSEIYYVYDPEVEYLELYSTYDTSNGRITTYQLWDVETSVFTTTTGYEVCNDDDSVFYSIEEEGFIHCKKIMEDSIVTISSDGNYAVDDLVELLKNR